MNDLANIANNRRKLAARLDAALLKLQSEAAPGLALCDTALTAKSDALRAWAESHPEEFSKGRKSIEFLSGTLGFRTGNPKLGLLSRAWNWDRVLEVLKSNPMYQTFVRTREEVDKEKLLATAAQEKCFDCGYMGMKITQDESFYVEPKLTDTNN
jgi:phage host-nuclease inhibitor protein Gam